LYFVARSLKGIFLFVFGFILHGCVTVLREAVMIFTNQIARIVHSSVHASGGDVNKNIGDAFLAVWKLSEQNLPNEVMAKKNASQNNQDFSALTVQTSIGSPSSPSVASPFSKPRHNALLSNITSTTKRRGSLYVHHLTQDATVSDKALQSFLNIIALLERSPAVQMYAKSSALQAKLPGFRVRMGFGLHLGWGIEVRSFFCFGVLHCSV
jgi:hypothetical protein